MPLTDFEECTDCAYKDECTTYLTFKCPLVQIIIDEELKEEKNKEI